MIKISLRVNKLHQPGASYLVKHAGHPIGKKFDNFSIVSLAFIELSNAPFIFGAVLGTERLDQLVKPCKIEQTSVARKLSSHRIRATKKDPFFYAKIPGVVFAIKDKVCPSAPKSSLANMK